MSPSKTAPSFTPAPLTPHVFVPMRAWPDCYVCLKSRWHPVHTDAARLSPAEGTDDDG
jgi:hypothetical protein